MAKKERPKILTTRFNFAISPELKEKAEALAYYQRKDLAELCRDLLAAEVEKNKDIIETMLQKN